MERTTDLQGEKDCSAYVMLSTIADATRAIKGDSREDNIERVHRAQARAWLTVKNDGLEVHCAILGLNVDAVIEACRKKILESDARRG